jgi:hypothetical protein
VADESSQGRVLYLLIHDLPGLFFRADHVLPWQPPGSDDLEVFLFSDLALLTRLISDLTKQGFVLRPRVLTSADELTALLAELKKEKVTHVAYDPCGPNHRRVPIDVAILHAELSGLTSATRKGLLASCPLSPDAPAVPAIPFDEVTGIDANGVGFRKRRDSK